jgi:hypothetical protein
MHVSQIAEAGDRRTHVPKCLVYYSLRRDLLQLKDGAYIVCRHSPTTWMCTLSTSPTSETSNFTTIVANILNALHS